MYTFSIYQVIWSPQKAIVGWTMYLGSLRQLENENVISEARPVNMIVVKSLYIPW